MLHSLLPAGPECGTLTLMLNSIGTLSGRSAAVVDGCAKRALANLTDPSALPEGLSLWRGEKRGSGQEA
jgi:hypothetical protein